MHDNKSVLSMVLPLGSVHVSLHTPEKHNLTLICYFSSYFCLCMLQENDSGTLDTVGAVVVDQEGNVAAAVSSGGLALKHPGRVGQVIIRFHLGMPVQ